MSLKKIYLTQSAAARSSKAFRLQSRDSALTLWYTDRIHDLHMNGKLF